MLQHLHLLGLHDHKAEENNQYFCVRPKSDFFFHFFFHLEQILFILKHCNFSKIYIFYTTNEIYVEIVKIRLIIK